MRRVLAFCLSALVLCCMAAADQPTAAQLLGKAQETAKAAHKNIFVMFDASW